MKKVNFSKKAIAAILSLSLMSSAIAAGVPVIDPANLAQAVAQVKNQVQQIENMRAQLKAMTDNGKYADIINNPAIRKQLNQYLPKNYSDVITAAQRGDFSHKAAADELVSVTWGQKDGFHLGHERAVHAGQLEFIVEVGHCAQTPHHGFATALHHKVAQQT